MHGGWWVHQLKRQIDSRFYERYALSQDKENALNGGGEAANELDLLTPEEAIRDPCVLEFLDLKDEYSESDLVISETCDE